MEIIIILGFLLLVIFACIGASFVIFKVADYYILHSPYRKICLVYSLDGKHCKVYNHSNPYYCTQKFQSEFGYKDSTFVKAKTIKILK